MTATRTPSAAGGRPDALEALANEGCSNPRPWSNAPGDTYARHAHSHHKVLFCLEGSITFHVDGRDVVLEAGDRLDLEPGTEHGATAGPSGCAGIEAWR